MIESVKVEMEDLENEITKDICELNAWKTPARLRARYRRKLTEDEIALMA